MASRAKKEGKEGLGFDALASALILGTVILVGWLASTSGPATQIAPAQPFAAAVLGRDPVAWLKAGALSCGKFLEASQEDGRLKIVNKLSPLWGGAKEVHGMTGHDVSCYIPELFKTFKNVHDIEVDFKTQLVDVKGRTRTDQVVNISFTRDNAATVNWPNVEPDNIRRIADRYWEAPVVAVADSKNSE